MAASLGPPVGLYSFGTLEAAGVQTGCQQTVNGVHFSATLGINGITVGAANSILRSSGTGAVKFSISLPFDLNEGSVNGTFDYYYGFWAIMTFSSATSGAITFDQVIGSPGAPASPSRTVAFSNYAQKVSGSAGSLTLDNSFILSFPHCALVVSGHYQE